MMKIKILGTAAAEGWPALFCNCSVCTQARALGGKNMRMRSSLLIDEELKIDFPHDSLAQSHMYGLDLSKLKYLFITHSHTDHLAYEELGFLFPPFAKQDKSTSLAIYGNSESLEKMHFVRAHYEDGGRGDQIHNVVPFTSHNLAPYVVTALKAHHGTDKDSLNYIVESEGKRFLYTCDTGFYGDNTWEFLKGKLVDAVICECTGGPLAQEYGTHMGLPDVLRFRDKADEIGLVNKHTRWILTHFSHGGGMLHDDLVHLAAPHNIEIAYDGMEVEL